MMKSNQENNILASQMTVDYVHKLSATLLRYKFKRKAEAVLL